MKGTDLIAMGFAPGPAVGLALRLANAAAAELGPERLERELRAVIASPADHLEHLHLGELAHALVREAAEANVRKPGERTEPAPYRVWGEGLEAGALGQMANAARLPVAVAGALMPDAHQGYGLPIGGVLATENAVIPYAVGVDIACFTGDTEIVLANGQTHRLDELAASGRELVVYACTPSGRVVGAWARAARTREDAPLLKVTLDNGRAVRCTPDHEFMRRDGSFVRASELRPKDALMPFYTDTDKDGYTRVQQNYSGRMQKAHWVMARSGLMGEVPRFEGQRTVIHHKNFDPADNDPANLEFMGDRDHSTYHRGLVERNGHWQSEDFEARRKTALAAKARTPEGHAYFAERGSKNLRRYWDTRPEEARRNCAGNGERGRVHLVAKNQSEAGRARSRELAARVHVCEHCGEPVRSYIGLHNHRRWRHGYNHRVVSVEPLREREAVYCLSVPGHENFALAAGVFVHNCRMKLSILDLPLEALQRHASTLERALESETRFGTGATWKRPLEHPVLDEDWTVTRVTREGFDKARSQLGTSGSGNHFVEFGVLTLAQPELGLEAGSYVALLSHSGSRGTGAAVANHYSKLAMELHPELPPELRRLAWLDLDSEAGQEYWAAMELMGAYASANHALIHKKVAKAAGGRVLAGVENHHNFAWRERHGGRDLVVHRKGATPAGEGVLGVIPGSMASPGFVVRGRGNPESLDSASHGAGRAMSRTAAKERFRWAQVKPTLEAAEVRLLSAGIDEVPFAYKDIEAVMAAQTDLVSVLARFDPRIVRMAPAGEIPED